MTAIESTSRPQILTTKLVAPRLSESVIRRAQTLDFLCRDTSSHLTLISAPAGYGKTTLARLFIETLDEPTAWLSLDESDSTLSTFLVYLVAAIQSAYPQSCAQIQVRLNTPSELPVDRLADLLNIDLTELGRPLVLILDDYHTITNLDVHQFMKRFIERMPTTVHVVIATRTDPPLPLARLRAGGQLMEIRSRHLQFSRDEAEEFLQSVSGVALEADKVSLLAEKTEGWPVGLSLLAMALRDSSNRDGLVTRLTDSSHRLIIDYLVEEVLADVPEAERTLLYRTAIFDRFCAPLCRASVLDISGESDCSDLLARLQKGNLFLTMLDGKGEWHRYHQLFRAFLLDRLHQAESSETISTLYCRASQWFEEQGYFEEAIAYALQAGDDVRAAQIVEEFATIPINAGDWNRLQTWLELLPESAQKRPGVLIPAAYLAQFHYRNALMLAHLNSAEALLTTENWGYTPEQETYIVGSMQALRALGTSWLTPESAILEARSALTKLSSSHIAQFSFAEMAIYHARLVLEPKQQVAADIKTALREQAIYPPTLRTLRLQLALNNAYYVDVNLPALDSEFEHLATISSATGQLFGVGWSDYVRGWIHYQRNELDEAARSFRDVWENHELNHGRSVIESLCGLIRIYRLQGQRVEEMEALGQLAWFANMTGILRGIVVADALAWQGAPEQNNSIPPEVFVSEIEWQFASELWEYPVLIAIRAHVESGVTERLKIAEDLLRRCHESIKKRTDRRQLIEVTLLDTLLYVTKGDQEAAQQSLQEAVTSAAYGGAVRLIADTGPAILPLLKTLLANGVESDFVSKVLVAIQTDQAIAGNATPIHMPPAETAIQNNINIEDLTPRELDVLLLLAKRYSNKEIASELVISPRTVQKHTSNIYQKFQVKNRRQAVAKAQTLGMLA